MKIKKIKKQLDQGMILDGLGLVLNDGPDASRNLHWALIYLLIDAYDQDITREAFANLVDAAINAKGCMAGAVTLRMMKERIASGVFNDALMQQSIDGNLEYANGFRADLEKQYALVKECRSEEDKVN